MEVQLDDFANAAFAIFPILLARAILHFSLALYIPLSLVDTNMARSQKRAAVLNEVFYFRTNSDSPSEACNIALKSIHDIIEELNGHIRKYLQEMSVEPVVYEALDKYLSFIADRASGRSQTPASLIRNFITSHPKYGKDSLVTDEIIYDLMNELSKDQEDQDHM